MNTFRVVLWGSASLVGLFLVLVNLAVGPGEAPNPEWVPSRSDAVIAAVFSLLFGVRALTYLWEPT